MPKHQCRPEPWFNINMASYRYRKSHYGDKTILRPSYLHNGISYTGKMTSLYWIRTLGNDSSLLSCHIPWASWHLRSLAFWLFVQQQTPHYWIIITYPKNKVQGAKMGPTGPRWAPCWPHELCYLGNASFNTFSFVRYHFEVWCDLVIHHGTSRVKFLFKQSVITGN